MPKFLRPALALLGMIAGLMVITSVPAEAVSAQRWDLGIRTIYVQSTLGKGWPVGKAIEIWDDKSRLNLVSVKRCPKNKPCISFSKGNRPGTKLATATRWSVKKRIVKCTVVVDTKAVGGKQAKRLRTLAHEAGHCMGFEHTSNKRDVLYKYNSDSRPWKPAARHYAALRRIYGK